METQADFLGYLIAREYVNRVLIQPEEKIQDDRFLFLNVMTFFDLMFELGARESASHPNPLDRICNIAALVYGEPFAQRIAETYGDPTLINSVLRGPLHPI